MLLSSDEAWPPYEEGCRDIRLSTALLSAYAAAASTSSSPPSPPPAVISVEDPVAGSHVLLALPTAEMQKRWLRTMRDVSLENNDEAFATQCHRERSAAYIQTMLRPLLTHKLKGASWLSQFAPTTLS